MTAARMMVMPMLFSDAYAEATPPAAATVASADAAAMAAPGSPFASLLPFLLIIFVFYFLMIRPQQKKYKAHQEMIKTLKKGDKVVTAGGILGTVAQIESDDVVLVEIASGVAVRVARQTIGTVLGTDTKAAADSAPVEKLNKKDRPKKPVANDN